MCKTPEEIKMRTHQPLAISTEGDEANLSMEEQRLRELEDLSLHRQWNRQAGQDVIGGVKWGGTVEADTKGVVSKVKGVDRLATKSDSIRFAVKLRLHDIAEAYGHEGEEDADFLAITKMIQQYSDIDATAMKGENVKTEAEIYSKISSALTAYIGKTVADPEHANWELFKKCNVLYAYFNEHKNGNLEPPADGNAILKEGKDFEIGLPTKDKIRLARMTDVKDQPLFSHEPSINDISQGAIGDCYLMAALAATASNDPQQVKNCMRDNGNGTVTVKFMKEDGTPLYVQVDKKVPKRFGEDLYAKDSLWVQILERAYVAARNLLPVDKETKNENQTKRKRECRLDPNYENSYNVIQTTLQAMPGQAGRNRYLERVKRQYPYYFDDKGRLYDSLEDVPPTKLDYSVIKGGYAARAVGHLTGRHRKKQPLSTDSKFGEKVRHFNAQYIDELSTRVQNSVGNDAKERYRASTGMESNNPIVDMTKKLLEDGGFGEMTPEAYALLCDMNGKMLTYIKHKLKELGGRFANQTAAKQMLKAWLNEFQKNYLSQKDSTDIIKAFNLNVKTTVKPIMNALCGFTADSMAKNAAKFSRLSGDDYLHEELRVFASIQTEVANESIMSMGTRKLNDTASGLNGESKDTGVVGTHAYTVLGTEERKIKGKNYKFIKLRNPWGATVRQYRESGDGGLEAVLEENGNQGIFLMELSDFVALTKHAEGNIRP